MPQRFAPDSHILSELVWDRVGTYRGKGQPFTLFISRDDGPYRGIPRGLDVLAAFGSRLAERILQDEGDTAYKGYPEKLRELQALYARGDSTRDLYRRWLGVLRHDTILYIKQSYTSTPRGGVMAPPPLPPAYVEPYPQVFGRLGALVAHLREGLDGWGMLEPGVRGKLAEFEKLLAELTTIARRELRGRWPTASEMKDLASIGQRLKGLLRFPSALLAQITSGTDARMAIVGDVHTHLAAGEVLEEAVGDPFLICVELERDGQKSRHWGAVFSYYEFKHPIDDRLTDEGWQAMDPKPPLPPWTSAFLAQE
jgi:hypothetical protein